MIASAFAKNYSLGDLATQAAAAASKVAPIVSYAPAPGTGSVVNPQGLLQGNAGSSTAGTSGGGSTPTAAPAGSIDVPLNYEALLQADPNYIAAENLFQKTTGDLASNRQAALRALVEQYGGLPAGLSDTYGDLTPQDLALASQNPYSITAQLARSYSLNKTNLQRSLAARGALESGDLGYGVGQLDTQQGQDQYNAGTQFANAFNNALSNYLNGIDSAQGGLNSSIGQAYQDITSNPAYQSGSSAATLVPNWQSQYGKPVYQDSSGNLYSLDANGNPIPYQQGS